MAVDPWGARDFGGMALAMSIVGLFGSIGGAGGRYGEQRFLAAKTPKHAAWQAALWLLALYLRRRPSIAHFYLPMPYLVGAPIALLARVPVAVAHHLLRGLAVEHLGRHRQALAGQRRRHDVLHRTDG